MVNLESRGKIRHSIYPTFDEIFVSSEHSEYFCFLYRLMHSHSQTQDLSYIRTFEAFQ